MGKFKAAGEELEKHRSQIEYDKTVLSDLAAVLAELKIPDSVSAWEVIDRRPDENT